MKNKISKMAVIDDKSVIENSTIEKNVEIKSSYIEESFVDENSKIGPFAHLRPGSKIGKNCKIKFGYFWIF